MPSGRNRVKMNKFDRFNKRYTLRRHSVATYT